MSSVFVWPVRVYYEDTDHGGVVYYANYLKFMERCRTELLRNCGLEQDDLINNHDLIFAVRHLEADYIQPARFNNLLLVTAQVQQQSRVKIAFKQQVYATKNKQSCMNGYFEDIHHVTDNNLLLCEANVTIAALSATKMRPQRMPETIFKELMREH